jgi:hypothetical protein
MQFQLYACGQSFYGKNTALSRPVVDLTETGLIFVRETKWFWY